MYSPRESLRDSDGLGTGEIKRRAEVEALLVTGDSHNVAIREVLDRPTER